MNGGCGVLKCDIIQAKLELIIFLKDKEGVKVCYDNIAFINSLQSIPLYSGSDTQPKYCVFRSKCFEFKSSNCMIAVKGVVSAA